MKIISPKHITQVVTALKNGEVIVFPTETSYGLGCDATNVKAVQRIFDIKGRPNGKGLPIIIPDVQHASKYIEMNSTAQKLAEKYWPGSLNVIAPVAVHSPVAVECSQDGTQSVRVSSYPFASELAIQFKKPIVATSANISGKKAAYSVVEVQTLFRNAKDQPDVVIDAGTLPLRAASTTVRVIGENIQVIREGELSISL